MTPTDLTARLNEDYAVTGYSGTKWTQRRLAAAFDLVAPKPNWKMPINALLPICEPTSTILISDAVVHFTGAVPNIVGEGAFFRVTAPGYYATIGA